MLRCEDGTIYTGITTDIKRRMNEHFSRGKKCAKYTFFHIPKQLEAAWETNNRVNASKLEFYIKKLRKNEKETLIKKAEYFEILFHEKLNKEYFNRLINF